MTITYQFLVGNSLIDITSYVINAETDYSYGDAIATMDVKVVKTINKIITLETGTPIKVTRTWDLPSFSEVVFWGYIQKYEPDGGLIDITCNDKLWDAVRKEVTHTYDNTIDASAGKISAIFTDLITTYAGLNADSSSVVDSGTITILNKFVCNHTDIMERIQALATILGWVIYYNPNTDKVYFEPSGYNSNSLVFNVGSQIIQVPKWTYDITEMCNDLTIMGASVNVQTTETGKIGTTPGYTNSYIDLVFLPTSQKLYHGTSSGATTDLLTGGVPQSTTIFDYSVNIYSNQYNPANNLYQLIPNSTYHSGSFITGDWYTTLYLYNQPVPVHMYSQPSIDKFGRFTKTVTFTDIQSVNDAENRGFDYLSKYSIPFVTSTVKLDVETVPDSLLFRNNVFVSSGILVGELIQVIDNLSTPHVNENFVISRRRIRYPPDYEELEIGDKAYRLANWQASVEDRLKRIQEEQQVNPGLDTEIVSVDNTSSLVSNPIIVKPRYFKITNSTVNVPNNILIWGTPSFDTWGTNLWGTNANAFNAETIYFLKQSNDIPKNIFTDIYYEKFYDTDFEDASNTTATGWGTGTLTFTSGQVATSSSIDYNDGVITKARLTATVNVTSGSNFNFFIAADGSTYQSVSNGTISNLIATGTDLRWKIAKLTGGGTVSNVTIDLYH